MRDILLSWGFSGLAKSAPIVMRALIAKVTARLELPVWSWTPPRVGAFKAVISSRMPPGAVVPAVVRATPRPMHLQEKAASCGWLA